MERGNGIITLYMKESEKESGYISVFEKKQGFPEGLPTGKIQGEPYLCHVSSGE